MKLLFRVFLSVSFLLLGGYGYLSADTAVDHTYHVPVKISINSGFSNGNTAINSTLPQAETMQDKIECKDGEDEDEEEEEDSELTTESATINNYLASFFYVLTTQHLNFDSKACLSPGKHFSFYSNCRYILFRSFRI